MGTISIAAAQMDVALGATEANLERMCETMRRASVRGASLVVFPECALSGYCYSSREDALASAETVPGPATESIHRLCVESGAVAVFGLLERDGDRLYNSAAIVGPDGLIGRYRKCHLPRLGADRFVDAGAGPLEPFDTPLGRLGVVICYDASFPEVCRVLKLRGAEVIALPTNWPRQAGVPARHQAVQRAHENHVHFVAVNRVGTERGFTFVGQSKIVDCLGSVLAAAPETGEELLLAELDPRTATINLTADPSGEYALDRVGDRRPELYGPLTRPDA